MPNHTTPDLDAAGNVTRRCRGWWIGSDPGGFLGLVFLPLEGASRFIGFGLSDHIAIGGD